MTLLAQVISLVGWPKLVQEVSCFFSAHYIIVRERPGGGRKQKLKELCKGWAACEAKHELHLSCPGNAL